MLLMIRRPRLTADSGNILAPGKYTRVELELFVTPLPTSVGTPQVEGVPLLVGTFYHTERGGGCQVAASFAFHHRAGRPPFKQ